MNNYQIGDVVLGNWKLVRLIGEGSFGRVYEAERIDFGMIYKAAIKIITIPQFGGVSIENNVQIGANTVICKGAIDDTIIGNGSRIDNCSFISHNVKMGRDTIVVGEVLMMGSSSTGERAYLSGNVVVRDGVSIGKDALVGMGAVVTRDVPDGVTVKGNPAK